MNAPDWTKKHIADLCRFWAEGLSTAEIGRRMSVSKNAVVGKAHRLGLPARPSPIKPPPGSKPTLHRAGAVTLPPLPSLSDPGTTS